MTEEYSSRKLSDIKTCIDTNVGARPEQALECALEELKKLRSPVAKDIEWAINYWKRYSWAASDFALSRLLLERMQDEDTLVIRVLRRRGPHFMCEVELIPSDNTRSEGSVEGGCNALLYQYPAVALTARLHKLIEEAIANGQPVIQASPEESHERT